MLHCGRSSLPGLTLSPVEGDSETAHFDLTLQIADTEQGLTAAFVYNTDLFEAGTIARMLENFQTLLEAVVADPAQRLSDLPLLSETERQQLLMEWNGCKTDCPQDLCIHQLFEAQVERTPDAIAVVFEVRAVDVSRVEPPRQSTGASLAGVGSRTRGTGGNLPGALVGGGHRIAGHSQGRRRVRAAGSGVSEGAPGLHAERCAGAGAVDPASGWWRDWRNRMPKSSVWIQAGRPSPAKATRTPALLPNPKTWPMSSTLRDRRGSPREFSFRTVRLQATAGMSKDATNWTPAMWFSSLHR